MSDLVGNLKDRFSHNEAQIAYEARYLVMIEALDYVNPLLKHRKRLDETLLMSTFNLCFYGEIWP